MERTFTEAQLKAFVISLRKKQQAIEEKEMFCTEHNFDIEATAKRNEAALVKRIVIEMEREFELGFVWDKSLN